MITIGIPNGATGFSSLPIPPIQITRSPAGETLATNENPLSSLVIDRSIRGVTKIGAGTIDTYNWELIAVLPTPDLIILKSLVGWQDTQIRSQTGLSLRMIDQTQFLPAYPSPHPKTLLSPIPATWNAAYVYGYGVFNVVVAINGSETRWFGRHFEELWATTITVWESI